MMIERDEHMDGHEKKLWDSLANLEWDGWYSACCIMKAHRRAVDQTMNTNILTQILALLCVYSCLDARFL